MRNPAVLIFAATLLACDATPTTTGPLEGPATNTGAIAVVSVDGRHKVYFPSADSADSHQWLAVADAEAPHATVSTIRYVDLGANAGPVAVGADGNDVVVVDGPSPRVFLIDARTDRIRATVTLPPEAELFSVSDDFLYGSGAAVDAARRRAWVSISSGAAEIDLDAHVVTTIYRAAPSENFAYDRKARALYMPFYVNDPAASGGYDPFQPGGHEITDGLTVVDLAAARSYPLVDPDAVDTHAPLGRRPDAVALDQTLGVAVLPIEDPPALQIIEQDAAQYDTGTLTCRIPTRLTIPMPSPEFSTVAADPHTHLAIAVEEFGAGIVLVDLALAKQGTARAVSLLMPTLPDGDGWVTKVDPHGVTVAVIGGKPYAFVLNLYKTWVARIDLEAAASLTSYEPAAFATMVSYLLVPVPPIR